MTPATILLVEDFAPMRRRVRSMVEQAGFQVIDEALDGPEAVQKAEELQPDLIVLDIGLPTLNGITAAREMRKRAPGSKILFLSQESSSDVVEEALRIGAVGYVYKARVQHDLLSAAEAVLDGRRFISDCLNVPQTSEGTMATSMKWALKGNGYEFCNCDFGCGCNFGGFPNSKDGSCRAFVGLDVKSGFCGDVDLCDIKCAAVVAWPKAIHEGNGQCVFVVDPAITDKQVEALGQIFTGALGGMPWELLGPTFAVQGLVKAKISIEGKGPKSRFKAEGVGEGRGSTFKNLVTGEDHLANIDLPDGFIWKKGECGQGTFAVSAAGLSISSEKTNWIFYKFDWANG